MSIIREAPRVRPDVLKSLLIGVEDDVVAPTCFITGSRTQTLSRRNVWSSTSTTTPYGDERTLEALERPARRRPASLHGDD